MVVGRCDERVGAVSGGRGERAGAVIGSCGEGVAAVVNAVAVVFGLAVPLWTAVVEDAAAELFAALPRCQNLRKPSRFLRVPCGVIASGIRRNGDAMFLRWSRCSVGDEVRRSFGDAMLLR